MLRIKGEVKEAGTKRCRLSIPPERIKEIEEEAKRIEEREKRIKNVRNIEDLRFFLSTYSRLMDEFINDLEEFISILKRRKKRKDRRIKELLNVIEKCEEHEETLIRYVVLYILFFIDMTYNIFKLAHCSEIEVIWEKLWQEGIEDSIQLLKEYDRYERKFWKIKRKCML